MAAARPGRWNERWAEILVVGVFELDDEGRTVSWKDAFSLDELFEDVDQA